jgi:hypothetical protein
MHQNSLDIESMDTAPLVKTTVTAIDFGRQKQQNAALTPKGPRGHIVSTNNFITLITCLDFIILTQC